MPRRCFYTIVARVCTQLIEVSTQCVKRSDLLCPPVDLLQFSLEYQLLGAGGELSNLIQATRVKVSDLVPSVEVV